MKKLTYLLFFLCFFSIVMNSSDDGILDKVQSAVDPYGKLANAQTKIVQGILQMPQQKVKAEVKSYYKKPDKYRIDTVFEDGTKEIRSYDGNKVWQWSSKSDSITEIGGLDRNSFLLNTKLQNPDIRTWRKEVFSSVKEYDSKIICILNDEFGFKSPFVLYIDKYLIKKMDMPTSIGGKELSQTIVIESYKEEGDILFASQIKSSIFGAEIDYQINNIKLNENIEDSFFTDLK